MREAWRQRAKDLNKELKSRQSLVSIPLGNSGPKDQCYDASILAERVQEGFPRLEALIPFQEWREDVTQFHLGPCGIGDAYWAVKEKVLADTDTQTPGFVRQFSDSWRHRTSGMIGAEERFPDTRYRLSCQDLYGFCIQQIRDMPLFDRVINQLRQFVSNHRRLHLVHGKNTGPNVAHQHPLLVMKSTKTIIGQEPDTVQCLGDPFG